MSHFRIEFVTFEIACEMALFRSYFWIRKQFSESTIPKVFSYTKNAHPTIPLAAPPFPSSFHTTLINNNTLPLTDDSKHKLHLQTHFIRLN